MNPQSREYRGIAPPRLGSDQDCQRMFRGVCLLRFRYGLMLETSFSFLVPLQDRQINIQ